MEAGRSVDVQYSNWQRNDPVMFVERECVVATRANYWITYNCYLQEPISIIKYISQHKQTLVQVNNKH